MTDVLAIYPPTGEAVPRRRRAALREHEWPRPRLAADLSAPRAHLAERAYAAELAHAEWARAHLRAAAAAGRPDREARP